MNLLDKYFCECSVFPRQKRGLLTALLGPASRINLESCSQGAWVAFELVSGGGKQQGDGCQLNARKAFSTTLLKVGKEDPQHPRPVPGLVLGLW